MKFFIFDLTRSLLVCTAVHLAVFGVGSLVRIDSNPSGAGLYTVYAFAMFVDAALLLVCVWLLSKGTKLGFYFSLAMLAINILLTIFDQFGLVDLLFVALNLATLIALLAARRKFLPA